MPVPPLPPRSLPVLPTGRPRRLLAVLPALQSGDALDRAVDLVQALHAGGGWVVRGVTSAEGPRRAHTEAAGCEVQCVDDRPLLSAPDPAAAERALRALGRQIWWRHLDAVAVFTPESAWTVPLARRAGLPVLLDVSADAPLQPPAGTSTAAATLLREARSSATAVCFATAAAADAPAPGLGRLPGAIIPHWHSVAPTPTPSSVCLSTTQDPKPIRALLDAAATGTPIVASPTPTLAEYFGSGEIVQLSANLELSVAHSRLDLAANPDATARRVDAARRRIRAAHAPAPLLARWQRLLEATAALGA